jgi:hypothetical protein
LRGWRCSEKLLERESLLTGIVARDHLARRELKGDFRTRDFGRKRIG